MSIKDDNVMLNSKKYYIFSHVRNFWISKYQTMKKVKCVFFLFVLLKTSDCEFGSSEK